MGREFSLSQFYIFPDPDFYPFRIPDPTRRTNEEGEKFVVLSFFGATNCTELKILFLNRNRKNLR
jgi:hypothetical protein